MSHGRVCTLALLAAINLASAACKGSTGPQGNANVVTDTVTLVDSQYSDSTFDIYGGLTVEARVATVFNSAITPGIVDSGLVLVYINRTTSPDSLTQWTPLPSDFAGGFLVTFNFGYSANQVEIAYYFGLTEFATGLPDIYLTTVPTEQFKIVAIAGSTVADLIARRVDLRNYSQVMAALRSQ